ncbi:NAD(P)H-binding protein [Agrococcus carbonis]|uniref:Putative NADH-flavin reductase n=1 Tax=Agrococcus carbonis TaxID=684552 RepID=A0A1H1L8P3_9MICO|nr:NAD(P)H-binding protein [Agrococcus carbonis]SDR70888.1 Putative NADH-flavin reductase [Agrococcus carbonis]
MARILVLGAHGRIALLAQRILAQQQHTVHGAIRNPEHRADVADTGAEPVVTDLERLDQAGVDELLTGYDVVVWSAGAGGGDPARTRAVDHDAAMRVVDAVARSGARLVMVSYFGSSRDHGVPADHPFHAYAEAKSLVDEAIRDSGTDWVILAPSTLTDADEGGIEVDEPAGSLSSGEIPRATVARLIAEVVARPTLRGVTIRCNAGATPVGEVLDALA